MVLLFQVRKAWAAKFLYGTWCDASSIKYAPVAIGEPWEESLITALSIACWSRFSSDLTPVTFMLPASLAAFERSMLTGIEVRGTRGSEGKNGLLQRPHLLTEKLHGLNDLRFPASRWFVMVLHHN